jgi:hypothetical protein
MSGGGRLSTSSVASRDEKSLQGLKNGIAVKAGGPGFKIQGFTE